MEKKGKEKENSKREYRAYGVFFCLDLGFYLLNYKLYERKPSPFLSKEHVS